MTFRAFNLKLDKLVRPTFTLLDRHYSAFQVCGYSGLLLAVVVTATLVILTGLSVSILATIILTAVLTFFGLAMLTKIVTGETYLVYYYHEIAILFLVSALLWILGQPVLNYLDITILGIGAFLVCGRVGCFMVGCCHGRPNKLGVCYREEHTSDGFSVYLVGTRLFPIQLVESSWVAMVVFWGCVLIFRSAPPGSALSWYIVAYGLGRFIFELARGDRDRPYYWGFSEAQWISLLLIAVVSGLEVAEMLPFHTWHLVTAAGLAITMVAVTLWRRYRGDERARLLRPGHVYEVAKAVQPLPAASNESGLSSNSVRLTRTSLGVQLSNGQVIQSSDTVHHYGLSYWQDNMSEDAARWLADLILQLRHPSTPNELICSEHGVYHLLVYASQEG